METLARYLEQWKLSNPIEITTTKTSTLYLLQYKNKPAALKLLTPFGIKFETAGAAALKFIAGRGCAEIYEAADGAQLLEYLDGSDLSKLVSAGQDQKATGIICDLLYRIHTGEIYGQAVEQHSGFNSLEHNFSALFTKAGSDSCDPIFIEGAKIARKLLGTQNNPVLLHGDIHHCNILESSTRGWLAIDPQPLIGERTYDTANVFFNPNAESQVVENAERILDCSGMFSQRLGIDQKRILEFAFAHGCLSACWEIEDGDNPERRLRITRLILNIIMDRFGS